MRRQARWWVVLPVLLLVGVGCGQGPAESGSLGGGAPSTSGVGGGSGEGVSSTSPRTSSTAGGQERATGVDGRVTTVTGDPVATATVVRKPVGSTQPLSQEAAVTDLDGRYFWPLTPGAWDIRIEAPGRPPVTQRVVVVDGQRATLDFVLPDQ